LDTILKNYSKAIKGDTEASGDTLEINKSKKAGDPNKP